MTRLISKFASLIGSVGASLANGWRTPSPRRRQGAVTIAPTGDLQQWANRTVEKIRTAYTAGRLNFPAFLENYTEETPELRDAYHRMLGEPTIKAGIGINIKTVAALDVQCHPENPEDPRERLAAKNFRVALDKIGMSAHTGMTGPRKLAWNILAGQSISGWSMNECVWQKEPERRGALAGKRTWSDFKARDTRRLWHLVDRFKNVEGLRTQFAEEFTGEDLRDFVFCAHWSLYESPIGISDMRSVYRAYWMKGVAWQLRALHLDRFTGPYLKGTYSAPDQRAALETALEEARSSGWLTIPVGAMVDVIDLSMQGTRDFESSIKDCDKEMLVGITYAHLQVIEGQGKDNRGDTSIHQETSELLPWWFAAQCSDVVTAQMTLAWYEVNYGDLPPCKTTWGSISDSSLLSSLGIDEKLKGMGLKLSTKDVYRRYLRSEPEGPDDVLGGEEPGPDGGDSPPEPPAAPAPFAEAGASAVPFAESAFVPPPGW